MREVLAKARELNGLEADDVAALMSVSDPELLGELFAAAQHVKDTIYGRRLVHLRAAVRVEPVRERVHLLRVPRAEHARSSGAR